MSTSFLPKFRRLTLKSPVKITSLFSLLRFLRRGTENSALKVETFINGCLWIVPTIAPGRSGLTILIKVDSSSLDCRYSDRYVFYS